MYGSPCARWWFLLTYLAAVGVVFDNVVDLVRRHDLRADVVGREHVLADDAIALADPEHGGFRLVAETRRAGIVYQTPLDTEFLRSPDFQHLVELAGEMAEIGEAPFRLLRGQEPDPEELSGPVELLARLLELGEKGLDRPRHGELPQERIACPLELGHGFAGDHRLTR